MRGFHLPFGLLAWLYVVVLWLTWTPMGDGPPTVLLLPHFSPWPVMVGNLLLFAPIGFVLGAGLAARERRSDGELRVGAVVLRVALAAGVLSVLVETGQLLVPGRHVSTFDVAMNTAGAAAAAAAWAGARSVRGGWRPWALFRLFTCFRPRHSADELMTGFV